MRKYYIYKIECTDNGKVYIGQTCDLQRRKREHFNDLKNNKHHSILLQRAYNKYGIEAFNHSLIEECTESNANEREIYWINCYNSTNKHKGFNLDGGGSEKGISEITRLKRSENSRKNYYTIHYKHLNSPKAREKKSKMFTGKGNPCYGKTPKEWMDEETYDKWIKDKSERFKENNPLKNGHTEESKHKISLAMQGKNNPFYGKKHSIQFKQRLSRERRGASNPNAVKVLCLNNDMLYDTITQASKELNLDGSSISKVCRGKINQTKGYKFKYVKES